MKTLKQILAGKKIAPTNTAFFILTPIAFFVFLYLHLKYEGFALLPFVLGVVLYFVMGFSITLAYHRLFAHRSFQASWPVRLFFLLTGAGAYQHSALKWASDHRIHHAHTDTDKDPYAISKGFFFAHMGWIMLEEAPENFDSFPKDLTKDPLIVWQHKHYYKLAVLMGFIVPGLLGWATGYPLGGIAFMVLGKMVFLHHSTFFVNSLAHTLGDRPYSDKISARDNILVAILTFGEGYHNYHHTFQTDYRNGIKWYHYDPTKWCIQALAALGLAHSLKRMSDEDIIKARIVGQENNLRIMLKQKYQNLHQGLHQSHVEKGQQLEEFLGEMKGQINLKLKKIQELKKEYQQVKKDMTEQGQLKLKEIKYQIKMYQLELKASLRRWQLSIQAYQRYGLEFSVMSLS